MYVDDEKNVLRAFCRRFGRDYQITTATSAEEAISLLQESGPFAVLITDLKMPGMDGIHLLTRAQQIAPCTVRIMLTGYPDQQLATDAIQKGKIFQFLSKPCPTNTLKEAIWNGIKRYEILVQEKEHLKEQVTTLLQELGRREEISNALGETEDLGKGSHLFCTLFQIMEREEPLVAHHQRQVARLARTLAQQMGLPEEVVDRIHLAGYLHDIGYLFIPAAFSLTCSPCEREQMEIQHHVQKGHQILEGIGFPPDLTDIVLQHHERLDGSGYPFALQGEETLLEARILAVADMVEVMISRRPYGWALPVSSMLNKLERNSGLLFDRKIVSYCKQIFTTGYFLDQNF